MSTPHPPQGPAPAGDGRGQVLSGAVAGLLLSVLGAVSLTIFLSSSGVMEPWVTLSWFALPLLGLVVLLVPAWRRIGSGFLMGLAIGSIVFAGACGALTGLMFSGGAP